MPNNLKELINYGQTLNVLFIEDNEEVRIQLEKLLKNFFSNIDMEENGLDGYERYIDFKNKNDRSYDLVITDLSMPKMDGVDLCKQIMKDNPNQLILVISAHTESKKLIELIDIGIYKFLQKPVDYNNLLNSLSLIISKIKREKSYVKLETEVKNIKDHNEKLNELVITDKLTSIYNRRFIDNILNQRFSDLESNSNKELSIIFIDIDDFKLINDFHGHLIGDQILVEFSQKLKSLIRANDILGRWGGEEFIIISDRTNLESAKSIAEKLRKGIENSTFTKVDKLTASFGIASYEEKDCIHNLIQKADYSLYKAKEEGKNKVCFIDNLNKL
ncbi:GGDEF domain-containing response regulator [Arcobacter sp. LA11]|uniref:GGDEF domain-containing response regulator n=1 Tax=Arcobacter sp. LA11 TaxID=1898176 RepID=UPI0009327048|nr:GGDEF domain-containing response regulator [Arcobacter sp. LA11]